MFCPACQNDKADKLSIALKKRKRGFENTTKAERVKGTALFRPGFKCALVFQWVDFFFWLEEQETGNFVDSGRTLQFEQLARGGGGMDFSSFSV